jgi:hypothetical protein
MINNFLAQGKQPFITQTGSIDVYMFPAQRGLSEFCVVMVLISVPIMLFVKPCSACYCPAYAGLDEFIPHAEDGEHGHGEANPNGEEQLIRVESNTTKDVQDDIDTY